MAEGSAGQVGGQAVQDQVTAGGSRDDAAVVSVEGHAGDLFFVVLRDRNRKHQQLRLPAGGSGGFLCGQVFLH